MNQEIEQDIKNYLKQLPKNMSMPDKITMTMRELCNTYDTNPSDEEHFRAIIIDELSQTCEICKEQKSCKYYEDCEGIFDTYKKTPLCVDCHEKIYNSLERKCGICNGKIRSCCC
jgi:hypothetical protein